MNLQFTTTKKGQLLTLQIVDSDVQKWPEITITDALGVTRTAFGTQISLATQSQVSPADFVSLLADIDFGLYNSTSGEPIVPPGLYLQLGATALNIVSEPGLTNLPAGPPATLAVYDVVNLCVPIESQQSNSLQIALYGANGDLLQPSTLPTTGNLIGFGARLQFGSYDRPSFWNRANAAQ